MAFARSPTLQTQLASPKRTPRNSCRSTRQTVCNDQSTPAGRKPCPPGALRSESADNSSGRLRGVSPAISIECPDAKVGIFVDIAPILGAYRPMPGQRIVDATAVEKSPFRLGISARHKARVARWMKHQTPASAKNEGIEPANPERKAYNRSGSGCVDVRLNSRQSASRKILLGIAVVAVVCFRGEPAVDVITADGEEPAGICGCPRDALAVSVLGEKTCPLQTDLRAAFLSRGAKS